MVLVGCATFGLCACREKAPAGQVVAIANGEEITAAEIRAEAAAPASRTGDGAIAPPALLRAVMDRKLWANEARRAGLDHDVDFILAKRRSEEALLADLQLRAVRDSVSAPSEQDVYRFLRTHPAALRDRTIFSIDQIDVRPYDRAAFVETSSKETSLDRIDAMLAGQGLVSQRSRTQWDSMFMPASLAGRLARLRPDELFFHRDGDMLIAANVIAKRATMLSPADRKILARQALMQQRINSAVAARLRALRASADIRLQPGFTLADPR